MSSPSSTARLQLEGVTRRFGEVVAVAGIDLAIREGEIVCLLGPSGCGKTTTLRIAAGAERPNEGRVFIGGTLVAGDGVFVPPERRSVGLVFQDYALFPHLSVVGNVGFGLNRVSASERVRRAGAALERVGLSHLARAYPHELSGGEQQRVALARALAPQPQLMLMDEPFSGLDRELRSRVRDDTLSVLRYLNTPTLLVTHDPAEALEIADRIVILRRGHVVQDDTPESIWRMPADVGVASFVGETNRLNSTAQAGSVMTPWGAVTRPISDGPVQIIVRPGDLSIGEAGGARAADLVVAATKFLGGTYLVAGTLVSPGFEGAQLRARLSLAEMPKAGARIRLRCEPNAILIFSGEG